MHRVIKFNPEALRKPCVKINAGLRREFFFEKKNYGKSNKK